MSRDPNRPRATAASLAAVVAGGAVGGAGVLAGVLLLGGTAALGDLAARPVVNPPASRSVNMPDGVVIDAQPRERIRGDVRDAMNAILAIATQSGDDTLRRIALRGIDTADVLDAWNLNALVVADAEANELRLAAWDLAAAIEAAPARPADPALARAGVDGRALDPVASMAAARFTAEARLFAASTRSVSLQTSVVDGRGGNAAVGALLADLAEAAADVVDVRFGASRALFSDDAFGLVLDRIGEAITLLDVLAETPVPGLDPDLIEGVADRLTRMEQEHAARHEAIKEKLDEQFAVIVERLPEPPEDEAATPPARGGG